MLWNTSAELHAALNDFPIVLLLVSIVFDVVGGATKRDSLKQAGFWTLVAGAAGVILALISGLRAEGSMEHGGSVHLVMERHQTLAITTTVLFVGLALWRILRHRRMTANERPVYLMIGTVGILFLVWTAHLGGTIVFRHGGGIPTAVLEGAMQERAIDHSHATGEEHDDDASPDSAVASGEEEEHAHPPGTPEPEHEE